MKQPLRTLVLALCCGLAAACTQRPERLKQMSYIIRNGIGIDNIQDIGRIARVILREAPDLVALQELDSATLRVGGRYIPGDLGRMTRMHATFVPGREEARVLLMAEFPDYTVCVTHLSLTPEDRHASLPLILQATDTCRKPVLLAGDFNTGDAAAVLAGLGGGFRILSDTTRMTFPSDNPAVRIDYILGRGLPTSATVTESAVDHTATASDHCPLWVTLAWKRGKQPRK